MDEGITVIAWLLPASFTKCLRMVRIGRLCHPDTETFLTVALMQMASSLPTTQTWNMISILPGIAQLVSAMSRVDPCTVGEMEPVSDPNSTRILYLP